MIHPQEVEALIRAHIEGAQVKVLDPMDDGMHLQAVVISEKFAGLPLMKQHKMVMEAVREPLEGRLHALQITTKTP
ncbi:MAG TPA: BolA family protein [Turneriella sp.]|nr:BolA family protein [Turneriella sp.]